MTDKQIIIDDCIHLNKWKHCDICEKLIKTKDGANGKKREHLLTVGDLKCDFYPNCYYKQLKRKEGIINILEQECTEKMEIIIALENKLTAKEQECEELKIYIESNEQQVKEVETLVMDNDRLINELDQLKAENETYKKMLEDEDVQLALTEIRSGERHLWFNKAEELKQTLTEIKEIAEKIDDSGCCAYGDYDCDNCSSLEQEAVCTYKVKKLILQKISEVEDVGN